MIRFTSIKVGSFVLHELNVSWEFETDPEENILDYEFFVLRSEAPHDGFEVVSPGLVDSHDYTDRDVNTESKWRKFYYKVRARHIPTGREAFSDLANSYIPNEATLEGLEIVSRNNIILYGAGGDFRKKFSGVPFWFFKRRTFGPRCGECYNERLRQTVRDNCCSCFGTGRQGGFYSPIQVNFQIDPVAQAQDHSNLTMQEPARTRAWTSNYPLIQPGDVLVGSGNRRYEIETMQPTSLNEVIIRQIVSLFYISPGAIEYQLEVPNEFDHNT